MRADDRRRNSGSPAISTVTGGRNVHDAKSNDVVGDSEAAVLLARHFFGGCVDEVEGNRD